MMKRMIGAVLVWILTVLGLAAFTVYGSSLLGLGVTVVWIAVPFVTWLLNLTARKHVTVSIWVPATMGKHRKAYGKLSVTNHSVIPVSKLICKLKMKNCLTKEENETVFLLSAAAKEESSMEFEIQASRCGYLTIETTGFYLLDWIGFLPVTCGCHAMGKISVLPDTFTPNISLSLSAAAREDAQSWSQIQKGFDRSEVFALREYVPGDSLKQIHWKLSSKKQQLIVREPSLPVEKSLLIFWDKNTREASAEEMDAMAESMASVCQEILNQGISFTVGWTEEKLCVFENIDTDEQLLSAIPGMLKHGADVLADSGAFLNARSGARHSFGKVIYLSADYPEDFEPFSEGELSLLLCGKKEISFELPTVLFDAGTYEEDLAMIEL